MYIDRLRLMGLIKDTIKPLVIFTEIKGSLGISVVAPYVGAKTALCAKQPPYLGGTTANPKEPNKELL
jgi:hypothetical protein